MAAEADLFALEVMLGKSMEPNEVPLIHSLFHGGVFRPALSTHILGIIQAVKRLLLRDPHGSGFNPVAILRTEADRKSGSFAADPSGTCRSRYQESRLCDPSPQPETDRSSTPEH
jgi:hypothetical protein